MAKAPKKPKKSAPLSRWEKYEKDRKEFDSNKKKKDAIIARASK